MFSSDRWKLHPDWVYCEYNYGKNSLSMVAICFFFGNHRKDAKKVLHPLPLQLVPTTGSLTALRTTCVTSLIGAACQKLDHRVSTSNQFQSLARRCQVQLGLLEVNKCKKIVALFFSPGFVLCPPVPATAVALLRIVLNVSSSDQGAGIQTRSAMILLKV